MSDLVPAGTVVVTGAATAAVPPREAALVAGRPAARREEFVAGRACARAALVGLGRRVDDVVLGVGSDRGPRWPGDVVGSITHGGGEVAAAVAWRRTLRGLGIDVETARMLDPGTVDLVASEDEHRVATAARLGELGATVLFSAKESVYKAWAPSGGWLEHGDVRVRLEPAGSFGATVAGVEVSGAWEVDGTVVRTAAWMPHVPH